MPRCCYVRGNIASGFTVVGPFDLWVAARAHADAHEDGGPAQVMELIAPEDVGKFRCEDCHGLWDHEDLETVKDLTERIDPGETCPDGQCPTCGSLCHLVGR